jgi:hypothetical protein
MNLSSKHLRKQESEFSYYPLQHFYDLGKEGKMSKSKQGLVCTWLWLVRVIIFYSLVLSKFVTVTSLPGIFFYKLTTS